MSIFICFVLCVIVTPLIFISMITWGLWISEMATDLRDWWHGKDDKKKEVGDE